MEERATTQLDLLAKIHNQIVDLKQIIVEVELSRPGASQTLQDKLRQIIASDEHISAAGGGGGAVPKHQKVIAPSDTSIQPGESSDK